MKENKKPSKKLKQKSIKDAANVTRISRRNTRDWALIGLERERLRTGRERSRSRSHLMSFTYIQNHTNLDFCNSCR